LLPVDSEHNAIFQCLAGGRIEDVAKIILTASGGPFRTASAELIANATPAQAVAHPNWSMGAKISVDSATMMNKGLELIEAHLLFGLPPQQVEAAAFAWLARATLRREAGNLASVTGARGPRVLGAIYPA